MVTKGRKGEFFWNFLADTGAKIKVQIFVLKEDQALLLFTNFAKSKIFQNMKVLTAFLDLRI